ncbi:extracellular triacylglycerol lipase precursor [Gymnopus androsaceus JB14]|uniref:Carboxylic ester hydrolase n=1 Tax=Gymnopus androsaceus JB14 TaxID=1447944 RepID=A0A6A4HHU2_9AGAR|nr:extracellular triacylglycerol lipase precursor [Gymnopus androsaceus JB14]
MNQTLNGLIGRLSISCIHSSSMVATQGLFSLALATTAVRATSPQVQLGNTTLIGRDVTLLNQDFFGGIPYAEPPLGALRFQRPVLKTSLDTTDSEFNASNFGLSCLQSDLPRSEISEDCLTINVFRPSGVASNASLPVMFWTYGGGFYVGSSNRFNASAIVAQSVARGTPVIYVSFNYRLGPLGFPQGQEAADRKALNLALSDQIAALTWVQENIGAFGGDKDRVTIFGESAGAIMTAIQLLNPDISKFARAAILQSGSAATALTYGPLHRQVDWDNFVAGVPGCENLAWTDNTFECLRSVNTTAIFDGLVKLFPWSPTIDGMGGFMPELPSLLFAKGIFSKIPFIAGDDLDEGTVFTQPSYNYTTELIESVIMANFSPPAVELVSESQVKKAVAQLVALYPDIPALGSPFNTGNDTFGLSPGYKRITAVIGDLTFQSQRRFWMQTASNAGVETYGYLFTQPQPENPPFFGGKTHSFVSKWLMVQKFSTFMEVCKMQLHLTLCWVAAIIDYWVSFATSLTPNDGKGVSRPTWDQYTPQNQVLIQLNGDNLTLIPDNYRKEQIDFINSMPVTFHH